MHLTTEQIKTITDMAYRLIEPSLIAINIGVDEFDFRQEIKLEGSLVRNAFYKGYTQQLIKTREAIIKSARNGSNPSIEMMIRLINQTNNYL